MLGFYELIERGWDGWGVGWGLCFCIMGVIVKFILVVWVGDGCLEICVIDWVCVCVVLSFMFGVEMLDYEVLYNGE